MFHWFTSTHNQPFTEWIGPSPKLAQLELLSLARGRKSDRRRAALLALSVACHLAEGAISCHPPLSKYLAAAREAQVIQLQPVPGQPRQSSETWEEPRDRPEVEGGSEDGGETLKTRTFYQISLLLF